MTPSADPFAERFELLYRDAYDDVLRFVRRRHPGDGAEDVVADAFLVAWRRFEQIPAERGDARAWLFGIARRTIANAHRSQRRHGALAVRLRGAAPMSEGAESEGSELRIDVARAWSRLSAGQQETLSLDVLEQLTSPQAARVLGITAVAYRLRLSRARRALRSQLEPATPPSAPTPASRSVPTPSLSSRPTTRPAEER